MSGSTYPVPSWWKELENQFLSENFHQFLLDGNVYDLFFWPSEWSSGSASPEPLELREFLAKKLLGGGRKVYYLSSTSGLVECEKPEDLWKSGENVPASSLEIHNHFMKNLKEMETILTEKEKIALVVDHLDKVVPETASYAERHLSERLKDWGANPLIKSKNNIIILIAENREMIFSDFRTDMSGTHPIRVPYPDAGYRRLYFEYRKDNKGGTFSEYLKSDENHVSAMVQLTKGFRLIDCERMANLADIEFEGKSPKPEDIEGFVKERKKDTIQSVSMGLLEPVESEIEFNDIGGLEGAKNYFEMIAEAIIGKEKDPKKAEIIPKGVLLAGPPGTGKTLLAKALAKKSGISLVKMGDIRSKWVGESERNMTLVLSLLKSMAPVVVFIDEIDQAIGRRSTFSGDSGVSGRIFGKILEFMGDNANRGDVIWIGATNRADLLDDAMIRRFDRVIPVLLPGSRDEWISVLKGILNQIEVEMDEKDIRKFVDNNIDKLRKNHSGSSMEVVIRTAYQDALLQREKKLTYDRLQKTFDNFKTNFNQKAYQLQTVLAISACNDIRFIERPSENYSYGDDDLDRAIETVLKEKSNGPLEEIISNLRREVSLSEVL